MSGHTVEELIVLMHIKSPTRSYLSHSCENRFESFAEMPVGDGREYPYHGALIEVVNRHDLKMPSESTCDVIPASTRRRHSADEQLTQTNHTQFD